MVEESRSRAVGSRQSAVEQSGSRGICRGNPTWLPSRRRGVVLLFSFVILVVLSSIAVVFVLLGRGEHEQSSNFIFQLRARDVATSGVHYAMAQLRQLATRQAWNSLYESDGTGRGYPSHWAYRQETFSDDNGDGRWEPGEKVIDDLDGDGQYRAAPRLESVQVPSFVYRRQTSDNTTENGLLKLTDDRGKPRTVGYSGEMGRGVASSAFYTLKVRDLAGMIWVNGPFKQGPGVQPYTLTDQKVAMLNTLGDLITLPSGKTVNENNALKLGERIQQILELRAKPFSAKLELKIVDTANPQATLLENLVLTPEEYDVLQDYLTPWMWTDASVVDPGAFQRLPALTAGQYMPFVILDAARKGWDKETSFFFRYRIDAPGSWLLGRGDGGSGGRGGVFPLPAMSAGFHFPPGWEAGLGAGSAAAHGWLGAFGMCPAILMEKNCGDHTEVVQNGQAAETSGEDMNFQEILMNQFAQGNAPVIVSSTPVDVSDFGVTQPRAPININTAPREVLISVLVGIQGWYIDPAGRTAVNPGVYKETAAVTLAQAVELADHIIAYRRLQPFTTWNQFERFIMGQDGAEKFDQNYPIATRDPVLGFLGGRDPGTPGYYVRRAIFANANPNTRLGDFNPDATYGAPYVGSISKAHLLHWTTEFCFGSMGYFEIESLGFIVHEKNRLVPSSLSESQQGVVEGELKAQARTLADVRLWDVYRHSSQRDFTLWSRQSINGQEVRVKSQAHSNHTLSYPENTLNLGMVQASAPGDSEAGPSADLVLRGGGAAAYDGYISASPADSDPRSKEALTFEDNLDQKLDPDYAVYKANKRGTAEEGRSLLDPGPDNKGTDPPGGQFFNNVSLHHLTQSLLFPDGFFAHESRRTPYAYSPEQAYKYGWAQLGNNSAGGLGQYSNVTDEYYAYPSGTGKESGKQFNLWKKGALEMWVKPTWSALDQVANDDYDTRTFFSVGKQPEARIQVQPGKNPLAEAMNKLCSDWMPDFKMLNYLINFSSNTSPDDPIAYRAMEQAYKITYKIGPEKLYNKNEPGDWGLWEALVAFVEKHQASGFDPNLARQRSIAAAQFLTKLLYQANPEFVTQQDLQQLDVNVPTDRLVLFARNRELAAFVSKSYTPTSGTNTFGNFSKASVPLGRAWKPGTWHHIALTWGPDTGDVNDSWMVRVFLDGKVTSIPYTSAALSLNELNSMFIGSNRFQTDISNGFPLTADATLSDLRIYNDNRVFDPNGFQPPDRYSGAYGPEQTYWEATLADHLARHLPSGGGRLGTLSWTERMPEVGGADITFQVLLPQKNDAAGANHTFPSGQDWIGSDALTTCQDLDEEGKNINTQADADSCQSKNGGGFGFESLGRKVVDAAQTAERIAYRAHFQLPNQSYVTQAPILEDVTLTYLTPIQLLSWNEATVGE